MSAYFVSSRMVPRGTLSPLAQELFGAYEPGAMYDPEITGTLYQDVAGTTPVTAVEQPVGLMLDLSGRGNHATQATTTKRPVYSRRVNLLINSGFAGAATGSPGTAPTGWSLLGNGGSISSYTASDGAGGFVLEFIASSNRQFIAQGTPVLQPNSSASFTVLLVATSGLSLEQLVTATGAPPSTVVTFTINGVAGPSNRVPVAGDIIGMTFTTGSTAGSVVLRLGVGTSSTTTGQASFAKASFALATDAHLHYQWVNTATDYDADPSKFPAYRRLDGVDDSHASATGGGGTAGFFFSASVTPQGGAGTARTLFSDAGTNTGYIVRLNTSNQLELAAGNGTAYTTIATAGTLAVGSTDIVQAWDDGTNLNVKIGNGPTASIARPTVSAGTAGYTMGQGNGASTGYFNGRVYSTIYRKDSGLTQVQREAVALYQRQKARMP